MKEKKEKKKKKKKERPLALSLFESRDNPKIRNEEWMNIKSTVKSREQWTAPTMTLLPPLQQSRPLKQKGRTISEPGHVCYALNWYGNQAVPLLWSWNHDYPSCNKKWDNFQSKFVKIMILRWKFVQFWLFQIKNCSILFFFLGQKVSKIWLFSQIWILRSKFVKFWLHKFQKLSKIWIFESNYDF